MMVQDQEEMGEGSANHTDPHHTPIADEAANKENVPTHSNDPLLSGEDRLKLKELMTLCTNLQNKVLDLEHTKTTQTLEIESLKRRVKKLEKKQRSRTHKLKRLFKVSRSTQVVSSEDEDVFNGEEVFIVKQSEKVIEEVVSTAEVSATAIITTEEITLAQALAELRRAKPKVVVQDPVTTLTPIPSNIKDKGKAKMIEPEKPLKIKEQIRLDEELAFKLQAKEEEQARLARENVKKVKEANISWDNVQA
ncbi:hypothetical protein Tco_1558593, partial [Tanacetum coccineum]